MVLGLVASLAAGLLYGVAAVGQAAASRRLPAMSQGAGVVVLAAVRSPLLVAMAAAYLFGALLHLVAIDNAPLYLAQTGIAAALPVTAVTSAVVLKESLRPADWVAIALTFVGIAVLAADAGEAGAYRHHTGFVLGLYVVLLLVVVFGLVAFRSRGRGAAAALSTLGGLAYSATTLAARQLGTPTWSVRTVLLVLLIGASGLIGFWFYSFAMRRVSVAAASAPLILTETLVPTIVGIVVLGDDVPTAWVIGLGLLLALAGAVYLAGFEGRVLEQPA